MLMYNVMVPMLMLIPLVKILEGTNGKRCRRSGERREVGGEVVQVVADLGFPRFNCRKRGCGVFR